MFGGSKICQKVYVSKGKECVIRQLIFICVIGHGYLVLIMEYQPKSDVNRELCSKVLREALLLLLGLLGLAGNHEQKMVQIKQKLYKGTKSVQGNKKIS